MSSINNISVPINKFFSTNVPDKAMFEFCDSDSLISLGMTSKLIKKAVFDDYNWNAHFLNYFGTIPPQDIESRPKKFMDWQNWNFLEREYEVSEKLYDPLKDGFYSITDFTQDGSILVSTENSQLKITNTTSNKEEIYQVEEGVLSGKISKFSFSRTKNIFAFLYGSSCLVYSRKTCQLINNLNSVIPSNWTSRELKILNDFLIAIYSSSGIKIYDFKKGEIFWEGSIVAFNDIRVDVFKGKIFVQRNYFGSRRDMVTIDITTKKAEEKLYFYRNFNYVFSEDKAFTYEISQNTNLSHRLYKIFHSWFPKSQLFSKHNCAKFGSFSFWSGIIKNEKDLVQPHVKIEEDGHNNFYERPFCNKNFVLTYFEVFSIFDLQSKRKIVIKDLDKKIRNVHFAKVLKNQIHLIGSKGNQIKRFVLDFKDPIKTFGDKNSSSIKKTNRFVFLRNVVQMLIDKICLIWKIVFKKLQEFASRLKH